MNNNLFDLQWRPQGEANCYYLIRDNKVWFAEIRLNGVYAVSEQSRIMTRLVNAMRACSGCTDSDLTHGSVIPLHRYSEVVNQREELLAALDKLVAAAKMASSSETPGSEQAGLIGLINPVSVAERVLRSIRRAHNE